MVNPIKTNWTSLRSGTVFKEFSWRGPLFGELSETATATGSRDMKRKPHTPVELIIENLDGAIHAEILVEYWGGHLGTSEQSFSINGNSWIALPQPEGTIHAPECYNRTILGNPPVEIPLGQLKKGKNIFRFHAGPQICHDFHWGFYWIYAFTVRVFYGRGRAPYLEGIIWSKDDALKEDFICDNPKFTISMSKSSSNGPSQIHKISLIGYYVDFDWEGNGRYLDWHYQYRYGTMRKHIGTSAEPPFEIRWDTSRLPDQEQPIRFLALIEDQNGYVSVSPEKLFRLKRTGNSVCMYRPDKAPEAFCVRMGQGKTVNIRNVKNISQAKDAVLALSTWSADHADEIGLNGRKLVDRIGKIHDYSFDYISVPLDYLKEGTNTFYIFSRTEHHAAEVNWPGPVLFIKY